MYIIYIITAIMFILWMRDVYYETYKVHEVLETIEKPRYSHYDPLIVFGKSSIERLVKLNVELTLKYLKSAGYYWANEVNIWTDSIFTTQLEYKLTKCMKPLAKEGIDVDESVRGLIKHYHLQVVAKYPELKEY